MPRLLNVRPRGSRRLLLGLIPILALLLLYFAASTERHALNPSDKILPTFAAMAHQVWTMGFQVDPLTGQIPMVADTAASLSRLGAGVGLATVTAGDVGPASVSTGPASQTPATRGAAGDVGEGTGGLY